MAHAADLLFWFGLTVGLLVGFLVGYWIRGKKQRTVI